MRTPHDLLAAVGELARPDAWHLDAARYRLRERVPYRAPALGRLGAALTALAAAWDARAQADADAAWAGLLLHAERQGQVHAGRVAARATGDVLAALCVGPKRSPRVAYADWYRRNGRLASGTRTWARNAGGSGRRL
jgi:hypothetical protein